MKRWLFWLRDEEGATAIEYGLIVAGVALAILIGVNLTGDALYTLFAEDLPRALER